MWAAQWSRDVTQVHVSAAGARVETLNDFFVAKEEKLKSGKDEESMEKYGRLLCPFSISI